MENENRAASDVSETTSVICGQSDESTDLNTFIIAYFLNLMKSCAITIPRITIDVNFEEKRQADLDKSYKTPSFLVPVFD